MGGRMQFAPTYHFDLQNEDVLFNPENPDSNTQLQAPETPSLNLSTLHPWNPEIPKTRDSNTFFAGNIILEPVGDKTRSIASLRGG